MQLTIETTANETIIRLPKAVHFEYLQQFVSYLAVKEILSRSQANEQQIDNFAEEAQENWWNNNKSRWIK